MAAEDRAAIASDLAELGADAAKVMGEWTGQPPADIESDTIVLPAELEPVVHAFLVGATQWRWRAFGFGAIPEGLDYGALRAGLALARIRLTAEQFSLVRLMELTALPVLQRRFAK